MTLDEYKLATPPQDEVYVSQHEYNLIEAAAELKISYLLEGESNVDRLESLKSLIAAKLRAEAIIQALGYNFK